MAKFSCSLFFIGFFLLSAAWIMPNGVSATKCETKLYDGCLPKDCTQKCSDKYPNSSSECVAVPPIPFHYSCYCFYDCAA
ncbi:hypothetical protein Csa_009048 [Cucumis sativus]|uniref:Uncharacterized protein n=1 Tax=Cucumis sativus TaxID=3659 RepID=A0A0A0KU45_CUCSA|nr:hypothetical protein Csa_009048 [Cucumis sativus]